MNTKGFTLIELTAIIVVFAAIFLVTFPNLINSARNNKEKEYNSMVDNLCLAGKSYIYSHLDEFPQISTVNSVIEVDVSMLITNEYIESNVKNPKTGKTVSNNQLNYKVLSDHSLECEYIEG